MELTKLDHEKTFDCFLDRQDRSWLFIIFDSIYSYIHTYNYGKLTISSLRKPNKEQAPHDNDKMMKVNTRFRLTIISCLFHFSTQILTVFSKELATLYTMSDYKIVTVCRLQIMSFRCRCRDMYALYQTSDYILMPLWIT